jgi:hypothetical protein
MSKVSLYPRLVVGFPFRVVSPLVVLPSALLFGSAGMMLAMSWL